MRADIAKKISKDGASPTPRRLVVAIQRLGNMGGQERSTLEVLTRLCARGWSVELISFELSDWPREWPLRWLKLPLVPVRLQLVQNLWFALLSGVILAWRRLRGDEAIVLTIGTAAPVADVRVLQFIHGAALASYRRGEMPYPNSRGPWHARYQALFARYEAAVESYLLSRSRQLIAISRAVATDVYTYSVRPITCPVEVVWHAIDKHPARTATLQPTVRILFVGALERKGIDRALHALKHISDLDWRFTAVGGGDLRRWREVASELGLAARVEFTGAKPASAYFQNADVFLFPSVYEPFGLVVTEAVSWGLVPLASRECGAMELWQKRPDWLDLSCHDDEQVWAQSLRRLVTSSDLRRSAADQALKAMTAWTWDKAADQYERILERLQPARARRAA